MRVVAVQDHLRTLDLDHGEDAFAAVVGFLVVANHRRNNRKIGGVSALLTVEAGAAHGLRDAGYHALDALRIEAGRRGFGAELTPDDTPLEAGLMYAVKPDKGVDFIADFPGEPIWIEGLEARLAQVVVNLIANAIHYTDQGHIDVAWRTERHQLVLRVQDTGRGIGAEDQAKIFNEFYRVDETRPLHDGLGLGLSIVKRLCQPIGAHITVACERGQGASFTVYTAYPVQGDASARFDDSASASPHGTSQSLHGKVVAVIEDDPTVREAYRQTLASKGAMVVVLPDEPQFLLQELELLDHLDLIVSDYRLRTTTGDRVIQTLRESFNHEVPAIIVTADTSPSHIHQFQRLNIPVLHKPASFQQIIDAAEKAVSEAQGSAGEVEASAVDLSP